MLIQKWQDSIKAKREKYLASKPRPAKVENYDDDPKFKEYLDKLDVLRKDGITRLSALEDEIASIKLNKQIEKEDKEKLLRELENKVLEAKIVIAEDQYKIRKVVSYKLSILENNYNKERLEIEHSKLSRQEKDKKLSKLFKKYSENVAATKQILADSKENDKKLKLEIKTLREKYNDQVQVIKDQTKTKHHKIIEKYDSELNKLKAETKKAELFDKQKEELKAAKETSINNLLKKQEAEISELDAQLEKDIVLATNKIIGERHKIDKLVDEALALSEERYKREYQSVLASNEIKSFKIKAEGKTALLKAKETHIKNMSRIENSSFKNKQEKNAEIENEKNSYGAAKTAIITDTNNKLAELKQENYAAYQAKYYYNWAVRNHVHSFKEKWGGRWQHFKANFDFTQWITKYALYFIIIAIFIVLAAIAGAKGHNFITGSSIVTALQITAPKIFFALGAACLILLGGTDLSIGRLTGIGVSFTLMILSSTNYQDNNGVVWFNTGSMAAGGRVILALLVSIGFCTAFSAFSGFFTAKFKIHPFITTLATQLISYGLFQIFWSATSTFTTDPIKDGGLMNALRGTLNWQLILYAIIAIAIVWFIWNKTKFGKNLYAVGGNAEAAKVSGINPFIITLLAFVMAGILYGFGGFVQGVQAGTGNFNFGYGTETDAIAACVIGGISFTGGVGKVSGAVIGCVVLGFLTYIFNWMGIDSNIQLVIKGLIIIAAVTLDCVKYIKRK